MTKTSSQTLATNSRADYPGSRHHVMVRGGSRRNIFDGDLSRSGYLALLANTERRFGVRVHGWALLGNHCHLLVSSHSTQLSAAMKYVNSTHARRFNKRRGHHGPLLSGRFASKVVESDEYWLHLLGYVHINPFKDGFVDTADELPWTSHRAYLGVEERPFLSKEEHLGLLGGVTGYEAFIASVAEGRRAPEGFSGSKASFPRRQRARARPATSRAQRRQLGALLSDQALQGSARGGNADERRWATWLLAHQLQVDVVALAAELAVSPTTIRRRARAVELGLAGEAPAWVVAYLGAGAERPTG